MDNLKHEEVETTCRMFVRTHTHRSIEFGVRGRLEMILACSLEHQSAGDVNAGACNLSNLREENDTRVSHFE